MRKKIIFDPRTIFYINLLMALGIGMTKSISMYFGMIPLFLVEFYFFPPRIDFLKKIFKYSLGLFLSIVFINYFFLEKDLYYIFYMVIRIFLLILVAGSLGSNLKYKNIGFVVESLFYPLKIFKFPTEIIGTITMISIKFIPLMEEEAKRIIVAQKSRGIDYELMNLKEKIKNIFTLFFPVIVGGLIHAVKLSVALDVRGYGNGIKRTYLENFSLKKIDYIFLGITIIYIGIFLLNKNYNIH